MKLRYNILFRSLLMSTVAIPCVSRADIFDNNGTTAGFGVVDTGSYDWLAASVWAGTPNDTGTATTATWTSARSAYFAGLGTGTDYTVRLGSTGATNVTITNLALNLNAAGTGALSGAVGNVTIGNTSDTGLLIINANNSVGALGGGTLTVNNGVNLNAKTMNFRGGNVVINGLVSGTGASKIAFGSLWGLSSGTLTLANTANTYAGRANSDYITTNYTLAVTKLANGGSNSSIGTSSANIGFNGGTLKYIGSTGAQSTTLGLHIASGGAIVDASGVTSADTISISGAPTFSAANQAGNITLTGANLGDNTMDFVFNNNGTTATILFKTGVGRWVVNQSNGYSGVTNAQNGTLVAANTGAFGAVGKTVNVGFNTSVGAVEFATDTTANAYVLNVSSAYTGTVVVNRATSGTDMTHTMGVATLGNGTLNIQKGANVTGVGTLELSGITMSAGVTGLSTGTMLNPTTANVLVSGNITRTGSSANLLTLDGTSTGNLISGVISGSHALTKSNTSTWELSNANTFTGNTKVTYGVLKLTHNLALQSSTFDPSGAGTLDVTTINTPTFGGLTSATNYALPSNVTSLTLNPNSGVTQTYTGNLSGGATGLTLTKTGASTQVLAGTNSYTGLTSVNGGELNIQNAAAIGGSQVLVASGAQLGLQGGITITGKTITTSGGGRASGTGSFIGGLQSVSGTNEWAGNVILGADLSRVGARKNATLILSGIVDDGSNTYGFVLRNETFGANRNGAGNADTVTVLSGESTYGGVTQIIGGLTKLDGGNNRLPTSTILNFGSATVNSKFDMNGRNQEVAGLAVVTTGTDVNRDWNANELTNSSSTLSKLTVNTATNQTFGVAQTNNTGIITGNIELEKSGTASLTLSGTNTYTGTTTISGGTLALTGSGGIADSAIIDVRSGSKFNVTGVTTSSTIGASTAQTLKGLGTVEIGAKVLSIGANGTLAPGSSPGTLTFDATTGGALDFASGSELAFELGTVGSGSDLVSFSSSGDWLTGSGNGTLALSLLGGFDYANTYTIFENVTTTGFDFAAVTGYDSGAYTHTFAQSGTTYQLSFTPIPESSTVMLSGLGVFFLLRRRRN